MTHKHADEVPEEVEIPLADVPDDPSEGQIDEPGDGVDDELPENPDADGGDDEEKP